MRSTTLKFGLPSPTYTYVRLFLTMLCLGLVVTACEPDEADQPEHPIHPVSEFIPYYDNDHVVVDGGPSVDALVDVPQPIRLLSDYLDDPESVDARELQTFVSESPWEFRVRAIDKHRLIMVALLHYAELERRMEEYDARLVEYDLRTDAYVNHADEEPDIGHLEQITDIKLRDAALSVAHMPQEISHFDCTSAPCVCDRTGTFRERQVVLSPRALVPVTDSTIAVFSPRPITRGLSFAEHYADIVKVFDEEYNQVKAFGSTYNGPRNAYNLWFVRYIGLEHSEEADHFAVTIRKLPYLYTYDGEGRLQASYQFDAAVEPMIEDTGRDGIHQRYTFLERNPRRSYYLLTEMDGLAVVVRESIEREDLDDEEATYQYDYHAIDLANQEVYHIGSDTYVGTQERLVFVTEAGLVLHDGATLQFMGL